MVQPACKILVVDDEPTNLKLMGQVLRNRYELAFATNGQRALELAAGERPDLVLLDIMMPGMDGYEVCRRLKSDATTRDIPVIFVTAMGETSDETAGLEAGAVDYLTKPISPAIVLARVKTHLERKRQEDELRQAYCTIEAQKTRMQDELNVGRDIQMSMVPRTFPPFPERTEFSIYAALQPAREVGGDFYDYFFIDENRVCACIGDVSGKGVPAALFMAVSRTLLKARAMDDTSTASIVTRVNDELSRDNEQFMFVTVFTAILDVVSGQLTYTNAGHNPPILRRANGGAILLDGRHGPVLGAGPGLAYKESIVQLQKGDLLLMYTDGITEARSPQRAFYGDERLLDLVSRGDGPDVEATVRRVIDSVKSFENGGEQFDDITAVALQYHREPGAVRHRAEMTIGNDLAGIQSAKAAFDAFCGETGLAEAIRRKMNLVLDELVSNIVSYAYDDGRRHEIVLAFELAGGRLTVTIQDDGMPFNPFEVEPPDTTAGLDERPIGGLGIHLVRRLMDKAIYQRRVDGNVVTLVNEVSAGSQADGGK